MQKMIVGSAVLAATLLGGYALANVAPPVEAERPVRFQGCVKPGVEAGCLIVESGGKTYNVTAAKASLKIGDFASGTGIPGGMSTCMQGEALSNIVLDAKPPAHAPCVVDNHPTAY
ncbi:MAG: hypothetical protein GC190_11620 [Alphaproteobacteria bacterium]|nr:hypothetical protein [Alphaproteobacteria bacterium]